MAPNLRQGQWFSEVGRELEGPNPQALLGGTRWVQGLEVRVSFFGCCVAGGEEGRASCGRTLRNLEGALRSGQDGGERPCRVGGSTLSTSVVVRLVAQSCPTLCNPMNCGTPGFPVLPYLSELALTHVH